MSRNVINLEMHPDVDVLTKSHCICICIEILEFLLYNRNQIEFVYQTYKGFVDQWTESKDQENIQSLNTYKLERQRVLAKKTKDAISEMRKFIHSIFEKHTIKSLRFLFGTTPKEAYTIHIPYHLISTRHSVEHHELRNLNQMLISLLTTEELYKIFSNNLSPMNLRLEMEIVESGAMDSLSLQGENRRLGEHIFPKSTTALPHTCKDIHIEIVPEPFNDDLHCCQDLKIFHDSTSNISINNDSHNSGATTYQEVDDDETKDVVSSWWESDIIVPGFKEKPIVRGGKSIWSN